MKEQVVYFLDAERHSAYRVFLQRGNGGFEKGQFYAGLDLADPDRTLQFEELLIELGKRLEGVEAADPCYITAKVRVGGARLLWAIHNSIWKVAPSYHGTEFHSEAVYKFDGKSLNIVRTGMDSQWRAADELLVYDRQ